MYLNFKEMSEIKINREIIMLIKKKDEIGLDIFSFSVFNSNFIIQQYAEGT